MYLGLPLNPDAILGLQIYVGVLIAITAVASLAIADDSKNILLKKESTVAEFKVSINRMAGLAMVPSWQLVSAPILFACLLAGNGLMALGAIMLATIPLLFIYRQRAITTILLGKRVHE